MAETTGVAAQVRVRRGDFVSCRADKSARQGGVVGFVERAAKDGSWADVSWFGGPPHGWVKRMPGASLRIEHTLYMGDSGAVFYTDELRKNELQAAGYTDA